MRLRGFPIAVAVAAVTLALSPAAYGQDLTGGVKGGLAFAVLPDFAESTGDTTIDTRMRTGLVLGGFVAFRVTPRFQLQPEVVYHQKGIEISGASGGPLRDGEAEIELTYVEVPLLAVFRFDPDGGRGGYVFGGPAFGFNTRAEIVGGAGAVPGDADLEDQVKDSEVSLVLGAGFLAGPFLVEARWTEGLSAVNEDDLFADLRNRSIAVLAGVRF